MRFRLFFWLTVFAACSSLPSCTKASFSDYSEAELKQAVLNNDFSFAETVTPVSARKFAKRDAEAALFLGLHLLENGKKEAAETLFESASGLSRKSGRYPQIDDRLQKKIPFVTRVAAFSELCGVLEEKSRENPDPGSLDYLLLLKNISEGEEKAFLSRKEALPFFPWIFDSATGNLAAAILRTESAAIDPGKGNPETDIKKIRALALDKLYDEAAGIFFSLMETGSSGKAALLSSREILSASGRALLYSETDPAASLKALEELEQFLVNSNVSGNFSPEAEYMLTFYKSRICSRLPDGKEPAINFMESSILSAPTEYDRDMSIWYLLDTARAEGPGFLLDEIEKTAGEWTNPAVFSDILSSIITNLTAVKDRENLIRLRNLLPHGVPSEIKERLDYIITMFFPDGSHDREEGLRLLYAGAVTPYYKTRAAADLGIFTNLKDIDPLGLEDSGFDPEKKKAMETMENLFGKQVERLITGTLQWHLPKQAVVVFRDFPHVDFKFIKDTAEQLMEQGFYSDAVRLVSASLTLMDSAGRKKYWSYVPVAEILYPKPWETIVTEAVEEFGQGRVLSKNLIFALIKQESLFNPDAVSYAGACGLTQLMKSTAEEIAGKLGIEEYNVFLPEYNIKFGVYYLYEMIQRLDGEVIPALCAYNAGMSRVREWKRDFGDDNHDSSGLFLEAIPYDETRNYAKNIFTFMNYYSILYAE